MPPAAAAVDRLLEIMARLRDPERGCPWDIEQTFSSIAPYTIEEAYEVADAVARDDMAELKDELGDLLLHVVYHSQMASELGMFDFKAVAIAVAEKMIRRHPHVFGDSVVAGASAQSQAWEAQKSAERKAKGPAAASLLDDIPLALPALVRSEKLQRRAARGNFDWPDAAGVLSKLEEEIGELRAEIDGAAAKGRIEDELGDILFVVANLARKLELDPEEALRAANRKFERRFRAVEQAVAASGRAMSDCRLEELEGHWQQVKARES